MFAGSIEWLKNSSKDFWFFIGQMEWKNNRLIYDKYVFIMLLLYVLNMIT